MIYTIGDTKSYEKYFLEQETPKKMGKTKDYAGGSVWETFEEAQKHCPVGYSIYGVMANWGTQTEQNKYEDWHNLLVNSPLVKL